TGTGQLNAKLLAHSAILRQQAIPELEGLTVDVPKGDSGIAVISGAKVRLRPTITAYGSYTPALSRGNANYLEGNLAPMAILLEPPFAIDDKFPTMDDTRTWLSLLSHYRHVRSAGEYELLARRSDRLAVRLVPLMAATATLGEAMSVPEDVSGVIWAEIAVISRSAGLLITSLFKPIPVYLTTTLKDGTEATTRINVTTAKDGFLLSPFLGDIGTLRLLFGTEPGAWEPRTVRTIRIDPIVKDAGIKLPAFYNNEISVRLF